MDYQKLRSAVFRKPFRRLRLQLHAGKPVEVHHPEFIAVTPSWVFVDPNDPEAPESPLIYEPERVVSVEYIGRGRSRR